MKDGCQDIVLNEGTQEERLRSENDTRTGLKIRAAGLMERWIHISTYKEVPHLRTTVEALSWLQLTFQPKYKERSVDVSGNTDELIQKNRCIMGVPAK